MTIPILPTVSEDSGACDNGVFKSRNDVVITPDKFDVNVPETVILDTVIVPPTFKLPPTPTPPETTNAPEALFVDDVVDDIVCDADEDGKLNVPLICPAPPT